MILNNYPSWGRYPKHKPSKVIHINWLDNIPELNKLYQNVLPYGYGKSYGDSCLNDDGILLDTKGLNKILLFDKENCLIRCQAGVSLAEVLDLIVPHGFFLASTPGTKYISVAGAVANDVHGKNHHKSGTFGCHVTQFELLRSNGKRLICSATQNTELFKATIGGLGLTGLILWVEFKIMPCPSPFFAMEAIKFDKLEEFFDINEDSEKDFDYIVSWVDCTATSGNLGRGIFNRGNHADPKIHQLPKLPKKKGITFPFDAPFINKTSVQAFNTMYYNKQLKRVDKKIVHYDPFFYPLDAVFEWNKAYGKNGFMQYQFVIPIDNSKKILREIMLMISASGLPSFLVVLKKMGDVKSPGIMSFPRSGVTLAVDFRNYGFRTMHLLEQLDVVVRKAGGVLYPAKDARMKAADFQNFYPQWKEFSEYIDPVFSSSFWRRVTKTEER